MIEIILLIIFSAKIRKESMQKHLPYGLSMAAFIFSYLITCFVAAAVVVTTLIILEYSLDDYTVLLASLLSSLIAALFAAIVYNQIMKRIRETPSPSDQ